MRSELLIECAHGATFKLVVNGRIDYRMGDQHLTVMPDNNEKAYEVQLPPLAGMMEVRIHWDRSEDFKEEEEERPRKKDRKGKFRRPICESCIGAGQDEEGETCEDCEGTGYYING